jgi:hypothetical protein
MTITKKARQERMKAKQAGKAHTGITTWDVVKADRPDYNHNGGERRNLVINVEGNTVTLLPFTTTCKGLEMWMEPTDGRDQNGNLVTNDAWTTTLAKVQKTGRLTAEQQAWVKDNL